MADQHEREAKAADRIFGLLPPDQAAEFRALWDEFEEHKTPEARFALACDRFHPMLLNCLTDGHAWRKHGITQDRVLARNAMVSRGLDGHLGIRRQDDRRGRGERASCAPAPTG